MSNKEPDSYQKLTDLLDEWFGKPLANIPDDIQKLMPRNLIYWDSCTSEQQRYQAELYDLLHDPANEEGIEHGFLTFDLIEEKKREKREWEIMSANTPTEKETRDKHIKELGEEIASLNTLFATPRVSDPDQTHQTTDKPYIETESGKIYFTTGAATERTLLKHKAWTDHWHASEREESNLSDRDRSKDVWNRLDKPSGIKFETIRKAVSAFQKANPNYKS